MEKNEPYGSFREKDLGITVVKALQIDVVGSVMLLR